MSDVGVLILAIEASGPSASIALVEAGAGGVPATLAIRRTLATSGQADSLVELTEQVLVAGGQCYQSVDVIAVGRGPGSFTGVRSAVGLGRALALAIGAPVLGLDGLEVLASTLPDGPTAKRLALIDARRGEVYAQLFDAGLEPLTAAAALTPLAAAAWVQAGPARLTGSGVPPVLERLSVDAEITVEAGTLDAAAVAALTLRRLARGAKPAPGSCLSPLYLRSPDARPPRPWHGDGPREILGA